MKHQRVFTNGLFSRRISRWQFLGSLLAGIGLISSLWIGVALGANEKAPLAYVTERDSNSVSVIDTTTNEVVDTFKVGPGPHGMVVTPDGRHGYVANFGTFVAGFPVKLDNTVSVIDTGIRDHSHRWRQWIRPPRVIATVEVDYGPLGVAVTPDGKHVYVTNFGNNTDDPTLGSPGNTVSVIKTSNHKVVDTIEVGTLPAGIAITPDGKQAYVTNRGDDTVSVIEIKQRGRGKLTNKVVATVLVGDKPANVVISPDGKRAYVTNFSTPPPPTPPGTSVYSVSVIDTKSYKITTIENVGIGPLGLAITPDGEKIYVVNVGPFDCVPETEECFTEVSVIKTKTNKIVDTIPIDDYIPFLGPRAVAITPDGAYAYVTNFGFDQVEVIDTASNTIVDSIEVPTKASEIGPNGPNWVTISGHKQKRGHDKGDQGHDKGDQGHDKDDWSHDRGDWGHENLDF